MFSLKTSAILKREKNEGKKFKNSCLISGQLVSLPFLFSPPLQTDRVLDEKVTLKSGYLEIKGRKNIHTLLRFAQNRLLFGAFSTYLKLNKSRQESQNLVPLHINHFKLSFRGLFEINSFRKFHASVANSSLFRHREF